MESSLHWHTAGCYTQTHTHKQVRTQSSPELMGSWYRSCDIGGGTHSLLLKYPLTLLHLTIFIKCLISGDQIKLSVIPGPPACSLLDSRFRSLHHASCIINIEPLISWEEIKICVDTSSSLRVCEVSLLIKIFWFCRSSVCALGCPVEIRSHWCCKLYRVLFSSQCFCYGLVVVLVVVLETRRQTQVMLGERMVW